MSADWGAMNGKSGRIGNRTVRNHPEHRSSRAIAGRGPLLMMPALAALGIGGQANALELGPLRMESALGEPLRASIAFALRPHEQLGAYCIRVGSGPSAIGFPSAGPAWVSVREGAIHVAGERPVANPLVGLQVTIDCPYAAHLSREYVVMVDPPRATPVRDPVATMQATPAAPATDAPAHRPSVRGPAIPTGTTYRVRPGDTLSGIAARLEGRRIDIWSAAERLFAANPEAFIGGSPDRLRAGAVLHIPDELHAAAEPVPASSARADARQAPAGAYRGHAAQSANADPAPAAGAYQGYAGYAGQAADADPASSGPARADAQQAPAAGGYQDHAGLFVDSPAAAPAVQGQAAAPQALSGTTAAQARPIQRPGDVLVDAGGLFVEPIEAVPAAAEAAASLPAASGSPAMPVAARGLADDSARSWLAWLSGSGVALILGLLLFGRRLKEHFGRGRHLAFDLPAEDSSEDPLDADAEHDPAELKVDFRFDDAEADARIVRVDADLEDGTGFHETGDIDVAQDFGFSASGGLELGLDIDFSEEAPARLHARESGVIVEQEIPPGEPATNEYDVSMIVDATRQPLADGADTEKDLHAIELAEAASEPEEDPFTLSHEVDYKILEQDYEEELTATQALTRELSNAARELFEGLEEKGGETLHDLPTVEMPAPGMEDTAELPRSADDELEMVPPSALADGRDTDVNEQVAELPDAGNDSSADLEIESAMIDTKKLKVS